MAIAAREETDREFEKLVESIGTLDIFAIEDEHVRKVMMKIGGLKAPVEPRERSPLQYKNGHTTVYNPDWHYRNGKPVSLLEKAYIVHHYRRSKVHELALSIGRTEASVRTVMRHARQNDDLLMLDKLDTSAFLVRLEDEEAAFMREAGFTDANE